MNDPKITYAVGDIHGCLSELKELVALCEEYHENYAAGADAKFVFIGDYVDRGPDSKGVIDFLMELNNEAECVFLRGNHEDMLMNDASLCWMNGGDATFRSYGFAGDKGSIHSPTQVFQMWIDLVPIHHKEWFRATKLYHKDDKRTYVHAGIARWDGDITNQMVQNLLWIRGQFLNDPTMDGGYVVHGHTPMENGAEVHISHNRCNVDTGCVFGGRLSAAVFMDHQVKPVHVIQVGPDE